MPAQAVRQRGESHFRRLEQLEQLTGVGGTGRRPADAVDGCVPGRLTTFDPRLRLGLDLAKVPSPTNAVFLRHRRLGQTRRLSLVKLFTRTLMIGTCAMLRVA